MHYLVAIKLVVYICLHIESMFSRYLSSVIKTIDFTIILC